jgi:DNA-binding NarL/FixJ family response regulator
MSKIRVVLVDDHALARRGVRSLLEEAGDIEIAGEAEDGTTALVLVEANQRKRSHPVRAATYLRMPAALSSRPP